MSTSSSIGRQFVNVTTRTCRHHENKGKALSFDSSINSSNSDIANTTIQMETNATTSPRQGCAKQQHEQRSRDKRKALLGSLKRFSVYVLAGRRIESSTNQKQKRKRSWWKRDHGDTSSDSSFSSSNSSGDESDERKGQPESSSVQNRHAAHGVRWRNNRTSNSRDMEIDRSQEYVDTLGYYEEDLAETIEDEIQIRTIASGNETTAISDFPKDGYDDDSIIKEVTSIETDFVRPGTACCYCAEPIIKSPNRGKKKIAFRKPITVPTNINRKSFQRVDVLSMLSDDDDYDEEKGDPTEEDTPTVYEETGTTVEDCEAMFMAELESSHCVHYNVENSHWKKGFDFVRS